MLMTRNDPEVLTVEEAKASGNWDKWQAAISAELQSLIDNQTWEYATLPEGRRAIGCRFTLKQKKDSNGNVEKFKARLVAQGFNQIIGQDYANTFAPVTKIKTILLLLTMAARNNWHVHQIDFDSAFLNASVKEEIFLKPPKDCELKVPQGKVLKLKKSIYGLKQAAANWFELLRSTLLHQGFQQSVKDTCMFFKNLRTSPIVILSYVDDLPIFGKDASEINTIKNSLRRHFRIKDIGELQYILGVRVVRDWQASKFYLDQEGLIRRTAQRYFNGNCRPAKMPASNTTKLIPYDDKATNDEKTKYQGLVGSLLYLSRYTRPEISALVGAATRYCSNPGPIHKEFAERILR